MSSPDVDEPKLAELRTALLAWFDENRRDLPWRYAPHEAPDPYRVWLSEVMLQQTRVETVKPYFERWLARFPTLRALAAADLQEVLKGWEGLGYYSRARNFHGAVREVEARYGGVVPDDPLEFRSLPGVGAYTAGAVMSIAFGRPEPVVDGNVRRVFARLTDRAEPSRKSLWELASRLVAGERPGDLNQSVMELGALVCTPRAPNCPVCPLHDGCASRAAGTQADRPGKAARKPIPTEWHGVAVLRRGDRFLLVRRPERGRLGGLWELPGVPRVEGESGRDAAERAARELCGVEVRVDGPAARVEHAFTHVRVVYDAFFATLAGDDPVPTTTGSDSTIRWLAPHQLAGIALPTAQRRVLALVQGDASFASAIDDATASSSSAA